MSDSVGSQMAMYARLEGRARVATAILGVITERMQWNLQPSKEEYQSLVDAILARCQEEVTQAKQAVDALRTLQGHDVL